MRNIAVIGSGQAGLLCAYGLRKAGYRVTLYSDRTPEAWLNESRPTGTAGRFEPALAFERELGLAHWEAEAPKIGGAHMTFVPTFGNRLLTMAGRLETPGMAIDLRLQSHRWMRDWLLAGEKLEIGEVTIAQLEEIAAEHDLTIVATGKGGLASLFTRDPVRSGYDKPQRNVVMICVAGPRLDFVGIPYRPFKFNLLVPAGEAFWIPYFHKDKGPSWNCLFEAKPGGPMDRFQGVKSGKEAIDVARGVLRDLIPWETDWFADAELSDENGWLVGAVTPTVRHAVGRLPSGRLVMPLGDTSVTLDPIAGQGANNGNRQAQAIVRSVIARADQPFDAAWMQATFDGFWEGHARHAAAWTRMLLEPASTTAKLFMVAQYGSDGRADRADAAQRLANAFAENFQEPARMTETFTDEAKMRAFMVQTAGSLAGPVARSLPRILGAQVRQKLGRDPRHPMALT